MGAARRANRVSPALRALASWSPPGRPDARGRVGPAWSRSSPVRAGGASEQVAELGAAVVAIGAGRAAGAQAVPAHPVDSTRAAWAQV